MNSSAVLNNLQFPPQTQLGATGPCHRSGPHLLATELCGAGARDRGPPRAPGARASPRLHGLHCSAIPLPRNPWPSLPLLHWRRVVPGPPVGGEAAHLPSVTARGPQGAAGCSGAFPPLLSFPDPAGWVPQSHSAGKTTAAPKAATAAGAFPHRSCLRCPAISPSLASQC